MRLKSFSIELKILIFSCFIFILNFLISCSHAYLETSPLNEKTEKIINRLTYVEANQRAKVISNVQYQLSLILNKVHSNYEGIVEIQFDWKKNEDPLRIDFFNGKIKKLTVNSKNLIHVNSISISNLTYKKKNRSKKSKNIKFKKDSLHHYNGHALFLSPLLLQKERNNVTIHFQRPYNKGKLHGLTRFEDPKDNNVYLSTHFEPYAANEFFPLFDQPDLKATITLKVEAPKDWTVISTMKEYKIEPSNLRRKIWYFPKSFILSSYAFSLYAGPFRVWKSRYKNIRLRIFSRASVAKYVYPNKWFELTRKGFKFFEDYFEIPYPYSKYDQLVVPNHSAGAMENIAAVSFNEFFLFKDPPTRTKEFILAMVLFHEMSHMWFGNLVTMKWWDDLWLNESFATYASMMALDRVMKDEFSWNSWDFFSSWKRSAYFIDDSKFTHPMVSEKIKDTVTAMSLMDSISYIKGSAILRQLNEWIGEEAFQKGLKSYLLKFYEKNAVRQDLFNALSESYDKPLKKWVQKWLKTVGFNFIQAKFKCEKNRISEFYLEQGVYSGDRDLRPHQLMVALFKKGKKSNEIKKFKEVSVKIESSKIVMNKLRGLSCPDLVYPNWLDQSYIRVKLDPISIQTALSSTNKISSSSLRLFLFGTLRDLLEEGEVSLFKYSNLILEQLKREKNPVHLKALRRYASVYFYYPKTSKKEQKVFFDFVLKMEQVLWDRLKTAKNLEEKIFWRDFFIDMAWTSYALNKLYDLLNKKVQIRGLPLSESKIRWKIIKVLSAFQFKDIEKMAQVESKKDSSYEGKLGWIASQVIKPSLENKKYWIRQVLNEKSSYSYMEKSTILYSLYPLSQKFLHLKYVKNFFKDFLKVRKKEKSVFKLLPFLTLSPSFCEQESLKKIEHFVRKNKSKLNILDRRAFHFQTKSIKTCLKVRSSL